MYIQEDSRQQAGKHEIKHEAFKASGHQLVRSKVLIGDYCRPPEVAIDTKASMAEIAQNIGGGGAEHQRFINELKLAKEVGCRLYILVENEDGARSIADVARWRNPRTEYSPRCIQGPRLAKAMATIEERYGCRFRFCRPEAAAEIIVELLKDG